MSLNADSPIGLIAHVFIRNMGSVYDTVKTVSTRVPVILPTKVLRKNYASAKGAITCHRIWDLGFIFPLSPRSL